MNLTKQQIEDMRTSLRLGAQPFREEAIDSLCALAVKTLSVAPEAERILRLEDALRKIARWHGEFPPSGFKLEGGEEMSYGMAYGSNGERDYMRKIALAALNPPKPQRGSS